MAGHETNKQRRVGCPRNDCGHSKRHSQGQLISFPRSIMYTPENGLKTKQQASKLHLIPVVTSLPHLIHGLDTTIRHQALYPWQHTHFQIAYICYHKDTNFNANKPGKQTLKT